MRNMKVTIVDSKQINKAIHVVEELRQQSPIVYDEINWEYTNRLKNRLRNILSGKTIITNHITVVETHKTKKKRAR